MADTKLFTEQDIEEGRRMTDIFLSLNKDEKIMAITYISALRDKQILNENKSKAEA